MKKCRKSPSAASWILCLHKMGLIFFLLWRYYGTRLIESLEIRNERDQRFFSSFNPLFPLFLLFQSRFGRVKLCINADATCATPLVNEWVKEKKNERNDRCSWRVCPILFRVVMHFGIGRVSFECTTRRMNCVWVPLPNDDLPSFKCWSSSLLLFIFAFRFLECANTEILTLLLIYKKKNESSFCAKRNVSCWKLFSCFGKAKRFNAIVVVGFEPTHIVFTFFFIMNPKRGLAHRSPPFID